MKNIGSFPSLGRASDRDAETGLDYAMNRYGLAGTGRLMTPDRTMSSAFGRDPGSWNRYAYVGGDPVNRTDPTGLCSEDMSGNYSDSDGHGLGSFGFLFYGPCTDNRGGGY